MGDQVSKSELARRLGISRGSLYYEPSRPAADEVLRQEIEAVMREHPGYGHRRVATALKVNRKRVRRVMRLFGLKPARRAKAPRKPGDIGKAAQSFGDITRVFSPVVPNVLWVSDFTFIPFHDRHVYLATVKDRFTREILGFAIMTSHPTELIERAFQMALHCSGAVPDWFHSDQGSEYTSAEFLELLQSNGVQISMSPKASPWRNASQESFFGRFKIDFGDPDRFDTIAELVEALAQQIAYYNQHRIHSALGMPPTKFRQKWEQQEDRVDAKLTSPPAVAHRRLRGDISCGLSSPPMDNRSPPP